jgi:purine-binding chemotaxis protein CheW
MATEGSMGSTSAAGSTSAGSASATRGSNATGSHKTDGSAGAGSSGIRQSLCSFWLGARCFGMDVSLVGEVVAVESITPVPRSHDALLGLFNLRGTPIALVDAAAVLSLDANDGTKQAQALVVRHGDLVAALAIDRMESVIEAGRGAFTPAAGGDEHPVVQGFLETSDRVVTVIAPDALLERLERLRPTGNSQR